MVVASAVYASGATSARPTNTMAATIAPAPGGAGGAITISTDDDDDAASMPEMVRARRRRRRIIGIAAANAGAPGCERARSGIVGVDGGSRF